MLEMKADNQLAIKTYEMRLGLVQSFQGTYVTVDAYMKLEPTWRAPLFTYRSIEFSCLRQWFFPTSLSSHFHYCYAVT